MSLVNNVASLAIDRPDIHTIKVLPSEKAHTMSQSVNTTSGAAKLPEKALPNSETDPPLLSIFSNSPF